MYVFFKEERGDVGANYSAEGELWEKMLLLFLIWPFTSLPTSPPHHPEKCPRTRSIPPPIPYLHLSVSNFTATKMIKLDNYLFALIPPPPSRQSFNSPGFFNLYKKGVDGARGRWVKDAAIGIISQGKRQFLW